MKHSKSSDNVIKSDRDNKSNNKKIKMNVRKGR